MIFRTGFLKLGLLSAVTAAAWAQEAESGVELRATVSAESVYAEALTSAPRKGAPMTAGFQALLYPTWKLNSHWAVTGVVQVHSRPLFREEFTTQGFGMKANILNASVSYSQFWENGSVVVRAGQMTSAFGAFLLRYDPAANALSGAPSGYGYYGSGVAMVGLAGAQVDATAGPVDARVQFTNSSPMNPRSVFDKDQYGTWTAGAGYTIRQGIRVGVSGFRGPYLDRHYAFFFPGEALPRSLPATGYGLDAQWAQGHWNFYGELAHFQMTYKAIPTFNMHTGYMEAKRVLSPRWYAAVRAGYTRMNPHPGNERYEMAAGFRPGANEIVKFGYTVVRGPAIHGTVNNIASVQFVTNFRAFGLAGR